MSYFFTLEQDLPPGVGFGLWDHMHRRWLYIVLCVWLLLCLGYRRLNPAGRERMRRGVGWAVLFCETLRDCNLLLQGALTVYFLPLHLCSLAVFFTFFHALHPGRTVGNFLFAVCMPGALFALLFPDWTVYPPFSFHSLTAFLAHGLLTGYPLMLLSGGDLRPEVRYLPRCLGILVSLAVPVYLFDRRFHANYMFLLEPSPGSPLEWFARYLGVPGYLLGYLPMLALIWAMLYLPFWVAGDRKNGKKDGAHP